MATIEAFHALLDCSLEIVESSMEMVTNVQNNGHQSKRLANIYADIGEYLEKSLWDNVKESEVKTLCSCLEKLFFNLQRGQALVSRWFDLLLTKSLKEVAFIEISNSLQESMNTLIPGSELLWSPDDFKSDFMKDCDEFSMKVMRVCLSTIDRAHKVVKNVKDVVKDVHINGDQCRRLGDIIAEIGGTLHELRTLHVEETHMNLWLDSLRELFDNLEKGQDLVLECASADWFELLLVRGFNDVAFLEIFDSLERSMTKLIPKFRFSFNRDDLRSDFMKDRDDLPTKIGNVITASINRSQEVVRNCEREVKDAQIYGHQCRRLVSVYCRIGEQLETVRWYPFDIPQCVMLRNHLVELFINLERGQSLIFECSSGGWIDLLFGKEAVEESFMEVYKAVEKRMKILMPGFESGFNETDFMSDLVKDRDERPTKILSILHASIEWCHYTVRSVKDMAEDSQMNGNQCRWLADVYVEIGMQLQKFQGLLLHQPQYMVWRAKLEELLINLQRGQALVSECVTGDWLELLLVKGANEAAFLEVFDALHKCMSNLFPDIKFQWNRDILKENAGRDREELRQKLDAHWMDTRWRGKTTTTSEEEFHSFCKQIASERLDIESTQTIGDFPTSLRIDGSLIKKVKFLAKGAYGKVYEAEFLGSRFAVKEFRGVEIAELQREVGILCNLRHTHIVQLVGFATTEKANMVLMELAHGDLRNLIDSELSQTIQPISRGRYSPFSHQVALHLMSQIASGMAYLHLQGVLHGDLKASNILYKKHANDIELKVADFGLSQQVGLIENIEDIYSSTGGYGSYHGTGGTRGWRAPEVFKEAIPENLRNEFEVVEPTYSAKADVYSFAITCWEILTGRKPFEDVLGDPYKSVYRPAYDLVKEGYRPPLPGDLDPGLRNLIEKCWATNPEERPTFASICNIFADIKGKGSVCSRQQQGAPKEKLTDKSLTKKGNENVVMQILRRALWFCMKPKVGGSK